MGVMKKKWEIRKKIKEGIRYKESEGYFPSDSL
jgi:hypothetical protein